MPRRDKHPHSAFDPQADASAIPAPPQPGSPDSADAYARGGVPAEDDAPAATAPAATAPAEAIELQEQRDKYLRLAAEYDNYRKRTMRERGETGARAQADMVKHIIDGLDDLSRFAHLDPAVVDAATVVQGVDMVERKLLKALTGAGLQIINPVDQTFDPALHEAVATEAALSPEDDHLVARVYQPGYVFNGQLLRPARVVVKQWNG